MASFLRQYQATNVLTDKARNSAACLTLLLLHAGWLPRRMPECRQSPTEILSYRISVGMCKRGDEVQTNLRTTSSLTLYINRGSTTYNRKEKVLTLCGCTWIVLSLSSASSSSNKKGTWKRQNVKSTILTTFCFGCSVFWIRWEMIRHFKVLLRFKVIVSWFQGHPWGFLSFLV